MAPTPCGQCLSASDANCQREGVKARLQMEAPSPVFQSSKDTPCRISGQLAHRSSWSPNPNESQVSPSGPRCGRSQNPITAPTRPPWRPPAPGPKPLRPSSCSTKRPRLLHVPSLPSEHSHAAPVTNPPSATPSAAPGAKQPRQPSSARRRPWHATLPATPQGAVFTLTHTHLATVAGRAGADEQPLVRGLSSPLACEAVVVLSPKRRVRMSAVRWIRLRVEVWLERV